MSGFSGDWLALREPFDAQARATAAAALGLQQVLGTVAARVASRTEEPDAPPPGRRQSAKTQQEPEDGRRAGPLRVIDLACGTGASLRALGFSLAAAGATSQHWTVIDHDGELLSEWPRRLQDWVRQQDPALVIAPAPRSLDEPPRDRPDANVDRGGPMDELHVRGTGGLDIAIERRRLDLAADLHAVPFEQADLVTASALLDLVSEAWIHRLVDCCRRSRATVLMALSVDGRHEWTPAHPDDERVARAFADHQRRDKGFGPALGGSAVRVAQKAFEAAGYKVRLARSDWVIDGRRPDVTGKTARGMLQAMIDGLASAACEQCPEDADAIRAWRERRSTALGETRLVVGHFDLLAAPRLQPD